MTEDIVMTTIPCRKCGAPFVASRTGYTVHCPACRRKHAAATKPGGRVTVTTCRCGKTVVAVSGVSTGVTCPRECGR